MFAFVNPQACDRMAQRLRRAEVAGARDSDLVELLHREQSRLEAELHLTRAEKEELTGQFDALAGEHRALILAHMRLQREDERRRADLQCTRRQRDATAATLARCRDRLARTEQPVETFRREHFHITH